MRHVITLTTIIVLIISTPLFAQDATEQARSVTISIAKLKELGYSGGTVNPNSQPLGSKADALNFIKGVVLLNDPNLVTIRGDIESFTRKLDDREDDKFAIFLLKHTYDLKKLFADNEATRSNLATEYKKFNDRKAVLTDLVKSIESRAKLVEHNTRVKLDDTTKAFAPNVKELNDLKVLKQNTIEEIALMDKKTEEIKTNYVAVSSEIIEDSKIESMVLDYNNEEWSDYLLDVDKVLYVLIGGPNDIQKGELKIDNKPSSFETSLQEALQVATGLGLAPPPKENMIPDIKLQTSIKVTFLLVKRKKIKAPATLEYKMPEDKKVSIDIHEKVRFGLKLGFSASYVTRNNFTINDQKELTISIDDAKKTELKSNLMALLEIIPWGRDIDRLESIFAKNKDIKFFDINRLSLVLGFKLSKDPLEIIYSGLSYSLSKTVSLDFGIAMHQTPKEVTNLPVGVDATLDYLKENADKELKPKVFFGISFSPLFIGKALGIVK